jgi:hypothetical protein
LFAWVYQFCTFGRTKNKKNMIKQLLSTVAVISALTVSAQSNKMVKSAVATAPVDMPANQSITYKTQAVTTITLNPLTSTNITVYTAGSDTTTPGCSPEAGYVFGSNCYGDMEKAQYFAATSYSSVTQPSIVAAQVIMFGMGGMGTTGAASQTVGVNIYNGTSNTSAPSTLLGTAVTTMSNLIAAQGTNPFFAYTFTFATAPNPTGGFYASLTLPTTAGDTAVVANETTTINNAWEKWSDNTWHSIPNAWGSSLKVNLAIFPIIMGNQSTVGITKSALNNNISIQPNPSNGLVNVNVALAQAENISMTVTNALGQQVLANKYDNVLNQSLSLDLTNQPNGVYFVTVSNGKDKMVQRLVINK